jgi:hypothetical protein
MPLPAAARAIRQASEDAIAAAREADRPAFDEAVTVLAAQDAERVRLVLGHAVRTLLEELHPDGLSADDVRDVLPRAVRAVAGWYPDVQPGLLVVVLSNSLGISEEEDEAEPADIFAHALLLFADLVTTAGRPAGGYLDASLNELHRAETMEMP